MDGVTREKRKRHTIRRQEEHIMSAERRGPTVVLQKELIRGETKAPFSNVPVASSDERDRQQ